MESTRTNSLNKGLETLGALITRAKSSFLNWRAHHSTNETKWQHILVRSNVESSIILCFWSSPRHPRAPSRSSRHTRTHVRQRSSWGEVERGWTRNGWHWVSILHMYLGRLDRLNCPLECSPVWKWISLQSLVWSPPETKTYCNLSFNTCCMHVEFQTHNGWLICSNWAPESYESERDN